METHARGVCQVRSGRSYVQRQPFQPRADQAGIAAIADSHQRFSCSVAANPFKSRLDTCRGSGRVRLLRVPKIDIYADRHVLVSNKTTR